MTLMCDKKHALHRGQVWRSSTGTEWRVVSVMMFHRVVVARVGRRDDYYTWHRDSILTTGMTLVSNVNARFWVWECDGWVRITLKPGQKLSFTGGGTHEEGYSCFAQEWEYDADEMRVISRYDSWGRDCDGPSSYHSEVSCPIVDLEHFRAEFRDSDYCGKRDREWIPPRPRWGDRHASQHDLYAEMAGY